MAVFEHVRSDDRIGLATARPGRTSREAHELLRLQRLAGNSAVSSLIAQRQDEGDVTQSGGGGGGGGMQMVNLVSLGKQGIINITLQNGTVADASAQIG